MRLTFVPRGDSVLFTARAVAPSGNSLPPVEQGRGGLSMFIARSLVLAQRGTFQLETDALGVAFTLPAAGA